MEGRTSLMLTHMLVYEVEDLSLYFYAAGYIPYQY